MSVIDKMVVQVGADLRPLVQGLAGATTEIQKTSKKINTSLDAIKSAFAGLVAVESIRRLAMFGKEALNFASDIKDAAEAVGITTQSLQELRYAALDASLEAGALDTALVKFSTNLGDAATGSGAFAGTLDRLGISLRDSDGTLRGMDEMLSLIADSIRNASTEQERLSIATDAFGKGAAAGMVRILRDGADGLADFRDRAQELGVVMSDELIERADEANKAFERLTMIISVNLKASVVDFIATMSRLGETWRGIKELVGGTDTFNSSQFSKLIADRQKLTELWAASPENVELKKQIDHLNQVIALHRQAFQIAQESARQLVPEIPAAVPSVSRPSSGRSGARTTPRAATAQEEVRKAATEVSRYTQEVKAAATETNALGEALSGMGDDLSDAFSRAIIQGQSLRNVLGGLMQSIGGRLLQSTIGNAFDSIFNNVLSGIGARASGGPVLSGMPYVVGERGPELFVPGASGSIVPNNKINAAGGGGGVTVHQTINVTTGVAQTVRAEMFRLLPQIQSATLGAVTDKNRRSLAGVA